MCSKYSTGFCAASRRRAYSSPMPSRAMMRRTRTSSGAATATVQWHLSPQIAVQQRDGVHRRSGPPLAPGLVQPPVHLIIDIAVGDGVQVGQSPLIAEHDGPQHLPLERAVRIEDAIPEPPPQLVQHGGAVLRQVVVHPVAVDDRRAQVSQGMQRRSLARPGRAGDADDASWSCILFPLTNNYLSFSQDRNSTRNSRFTTRCSDRPLPAIQHREQSQTGRLLLQAL